MQFIAVNYHYLGDKNHEYEGIYSVSREKFKKQILKLAELFTFVTLEDIAHAIIGKKSLPDFSCLITFDDGLKEQYDIGFSTLQEMDIPGAFFVNARPLVEKKILSVHKIHILRSTIAPNIFLSKIQTSYRAHTGENIDRILESLTDAEVRRNYFYDNLNVARIKYILSKKMLSAELRLGIIDDIFREYFSDEQRIFDNLYMSASQIREISENKMIGMHGYGHEPVEDFDSMQTEVRSWKNTLSAYLSLKVEPLFISYPYGITGSRDQLARCLREENIVGGFTMERAINTDLEPPYFLARLDTNDAPEGTRPLFEIHAGDMNVIDQRLKTSRGI